MNLREVVKQVPGSCGFLNCLRCSTDGHFVELDGGYAYAYEEQAPVWPVRDSLVDEMPSLGEAQQNQCNRCHKSDEEKQDP